MTSTATNTITMGEFRELTQRVPNDWPMFLVTQEDDQFVPAPIDASVYVTGQCVEITNDTHITKP